MGANEDLLDDLLKSVSDDSLKGNNGGNSLDMDSLFADMDSLDMDTLDLGALDLDTLGELPEIGSPLPATESSSGSGLDEALTMTQEEIEQLLRESQESSVQEESHFDVNSDDLSQLLSGFDGEARESADEISTLLQKADNNEVIDESMAERMQQEESFDDSSDLFLASLGEEEKPEKKGLFGRKKKEKAPKEKKEKPVKEKKKSRKAKKQEEEAAVPESQEEEVFVETLEIVEDVKDVKEKKKAKEKAPKEKKEKKKGGLGSKFAALFADAQEDEADEILATLQQQNDAILIEMQEEDQIAIKEKKSSKKAKKSKKENKPKKEKKPKKQKQPKKEKITKIDSAEKEPKQYFPMKKAMTIVFVCVMLMAAFLVLNNVLSTHSNGLAAAEAYEDERYMECYQLLMGQDLTPEQEKMFYRSELILQMRMFKQHCNEYLNAGKELEAVDKLVQFVYDYEQLLDYATRHECVDIVEPAYAEVLAALQSYGVSEADALAIGEEITDKDYTRALYRVIEGKNKKEENVVIEPIFKDMLPEEAGRQP